MCLCVRVCVRVRVCARVSLRVRVRVWIPVGPVVSGCVRVLASAVVPYYTYGAPQFAGPAGSPHDDEAYGTQLSRPD